MGFLALFKSPENKKLTQALARLDEVEHQIRLVRLEWQESYDKIHHALDRVGKRWSRALAENSVPNNGAKNAPVSPTSTEDLWKIARERGMVR
jgi:hypothetical protein